MKQVWMPEYLYNIGMPFEWFQERVDDNNVFKLSKGMIDFIKRKVIIQGDK